MRKQCWFTASILLLPLFLGTVSGTAQEPLIIESEEGGQNTEFYEEVLGSWGRSESKSKAPGLSDVSLGSRFVQFSTPPFEAEAHFKPVLPQAGYYRVSVTWGRSGNVKNAKFVVEAPPDISKTIYMDQDGGGGTGSPNGDKWNSLGIYKLPVEGAVVKIIGDEVTDITTQGYNFRIYADAVKFEPVSESEALQPEPTRPAATPALPPVAPAQAAPFTGAASAAPSAPSSPFVSGGVPAAPAQPATVSSPFGAPATQPSAPAAASSPFGAPPAAPRPATASSPFGAPPAAAPATSSMPFPPAPAPATASSPFAGRPGAATATSPFPAAPPAAPVPAAASTSPFGAPPASVATASSASMGSPFGAPPATTGTSPFPAAPAPAAPAPAAAPMSGSPFPSAPAAPSTGASPFGAPSAPSAAPAPAPATAFASGPPAAPASPGVFAAYATPQAPPPTPVPTAPPIAAAVMEPQPPLIQLKWLEYPEALIEGKKANRSIILHFHSNVGPAKKFLDEVLSDPNVQLQLQRFVLARIMLQDQQDLVKYYHVERAPTLIFLGPDGYTRLRIDGPVAAEALAAQLARQR